ncbi:hypothetical protein PR048_016997 [Dryococelus australis]|uniref:DUF4371 domain-containing protein n=1 Tax=Dryococelus australis TaxID=614101 RepID=A0ABQ9H8C4_9NEOP|nr:hypothetical protein PR048_016997 [Dryococelus australis]
MPEFFAILPSIKQRSLEDEPPGLSSTQSSTSANDNTFSKEESRSISSCSPQRSSLTVSDTLLTELRSKDSKLIKKFYVERQKNFQYTLATFQNELLSIIGEQIKLEIGNKVREAKFFAIIADETQHIAKHKEVAVVLRHDNENLENVLVSIELDIKILRAQCYDGVSNKRGLHKRVAARILEENPTAMYIHGNAHVLNLCIVTCCTGVTSIRNTFFYKKFCGGTVTLKSSSDTRWACCVEPVRSLLDNFEATLGGQANALLKSMEDFNLVFDLLLLRRVIMQCNLSPKTL